VTDESIFAAALAIPDGAQRVAYLDRACAADAGLRRQVEELLAAHAADNPLDRPPADLGRTGAYEPPAERPGATVGPYKLLQEIGEGGMGTVFMAEQTAPVRRKVALKIIKPGMDSKQVVARFEAERQALSMMDHPNIAKVLDAGTTASGRPFFVMELVHGVPIIEFCDANKLTPQQRLELFVPVCQAIQHAHQKGIIHRDIKPGNILVTMYDDRPVPKVIDFGVAKAVEQRLTERTLFTQFGVLVGTFEYMSPEQAEMNAFGVDTRSDVYSLGVLLYELLTGSTPLERQRLRGAALGEVVRLIKEEEPPRPSLRLSTSGTLAKVAAARRTEPAKLSALVRGELDWIVMRCLEKDRARRYDTASALARDAERYLRDEPVEACPPTVGYRLRKSLRKHRGPVTATAVVVLALVAGVVGTTLGLLEARRQRDAAREAETVADDRRREVERTAASLQVDLDLAEYRQDPRCGLLRLARTLKDLSAKQGDLREFLVAALLVGGQDRAPLLPPMTHDGAEITRVWLSPDSQTVLTLGKDFSARLWEARTARPIAVLRKGNERVVNCGFSPDGRTVFTDDQTSVGRLWDAPAGRLRAQIEPRPNRYSLSFAGMSNPWNYHEAWAAAQINTGRLLTQLSVGKESGHGWGGPVELWDTSTGRLVARLDEPGRLVRGFEFLGDGRWVTVSEGPSTLVFSADDGRLLARLNHGPMTSVEAVFASPTGRRIGTTYHDQGKRYLRMWDTSSWRAEPETMLLPTKRLADPEFLTDDTFALYDIVGMVPAHCGLIVYRYGQTEPLAQIADPWPNLPRVGDLAHSGDGRLFDTRTWQRLRPPAERKYHPDLARFAPDGRFVSANINGDYFLIDTRTDKSFPAPEDWHNLPGFGAVTTVQNYGAAVRLIPPADRLDLPADLLELWAQVAVRGEIGSDGSFVKWDELTWERKRQELAARPAPWPDFPFPGHVAADRLHWLRKEYDSASDAGKPRLAKQLLDRAEAAGDQAEALRWREGAKRP
jgi:serine/threonine protein kinase/WD40 repeat protein